MVAALRSVRQRHPPLCGQPSRQRRHSKHHFTTLAATHPCKIKVDVRPQGQKAAVRDVSVPDGSLQLNYDGGASVHPAEVQDQLTVAVALQHHGDAPVLLVEVAGGVVRDFAVLGLGAVTGSSPGRDVQDALGHLR